MNSKCAHVNFGLLTFQNGAIIYDQSSRRTSVAPFAFTEYMERDKLKQKRSATYKYSILIPSDLHANNTTRVTSIK